jgi:hypothetical protein
MRRWIRVASITIGAAAAVGCAVWAFQTAVGKTAMTGVVVSSRNVALEVADQTGPVGQITVGRVRAPGDSWVVVATPATLDAPSAIVGVAHVGPGEHRGVVVPLEAGVALNQQLVITLHADRGEAGRFEFDESRFDTSPDKPYYADGVPVTATAIKDGAALSLAAGAGSSPAQEVRAAPGSAVIEVAGRLTVIDQLVIDKVVAPGPSWVAVYLVADDGKPSALAGHVAVGAGETLGVTVPIAADMTLTDKILVALHADLGAAGVFEYTPGDFSGSIDKPYAAGEAELSRAVLLRGYGMSNDNVSGSSGSGM